MAVTYTAKSGTTSATTDTGNLIGQQFKPNQTVDSAGGVTGIEVSPRVQDAAGAAQLTGARIGTDMKGITGDVTLIRGIEIPIESDTSGTRTVGDVQGISFINRIATGETISNEMVALKVAAPEQPGVVWTSFAQFDVSSGLAAKHTSTGAALPGDAGTLKVKVGDTYYYIALFNVA